MYTSNAAQHLLSQSPHLLPHSSLKVFAFKSVSATLKPRLLVPHTSLSQLFSLSPSHLRCTRTFLAVRALGSNEANDEDEDDVYVKSFRPSRSSEQPSPRMGDGGGQERAGSKPGFKSQRGSRPFGRQGLGGTRDTSVEGQDSVTNSSRASVASSTRASFASRGRGRGRGGSAARGAPVKSEKPRNGLVLDEATGEMVEYRHPDWKEDPKAARKARREPAVAPQVQFETPMSKQPHVAILGGGMSGLVCALTLEELGIRSTVFDTVRRSPFPSSSPTILLTCY